MNTNAGPLQQVTRNIRRLRAANPSPMTGEGTNTYLIDTETGVVVLDPGPDLAAHFDAILACLDGAPVAAILVSHAHLDHSALAPRLSDRTNAAVMGFGTATDGRSPVMQGLAAAGLTGGGEGVDGGFKPDQRLQDGQILRFGAPQIEVLHCPGHMGGHLCFAMAGLLFSGDHVMGWSTSLISPPDGDMADYMASLARLARRSWQQFLPGHGSTVDQPAARLAALVTHRLSREAAVLAAVRSGSRTAREIAARVYLDTPAPLQAAATRNVLAHLIDLHDRNQIAAESITSFDSPFTPI
jgi:glyoxylase-like metal-dependent hydrolase (beta-lactamase superfamily II)